MTAIRWRKSSRGGQESNCVELPHTLDAVRDSKNGDVLALDRTSVAGLLGSAKHEQ